MSSVIIGGRINGRECEIWIERTAGGPLLGISVEDPGDEQNSILMPMEIAVLLIRNLYTQRRLLMALASEERVKTIVEKGGDIVEFLQNFRADDWDSYI